MSCRRQLSDEEYALWSGFARSITPLWTAKSKTKPKPALNSAVKSKPELNASAAANTKASRPKTQLERPPAKSLPLAPFDRRLKQRVARGRDAIDARIDLHGMTQGEAHSALFRFLRRAQADGQRIALIVTGKGTTTRNAQSERGVLRRQVPLWLSLPEFRPFVVGFEEAHVSHGGQGALYVRLRRVR